jgi:uncharacterized protein (DUF1810 family)
VTAAGPGRFDLERFVEAQDAGGTYERALEELRQGRKRSHWMWFVFPQVAGLGHSATSRRFAITSLDEAKAFLAHPVLGARLRQSVSALAELPEPDAEAVLGPIDAQKLRSCLTLFMRAAPETPLFAEVLDLYFGGVPDAETDERI